MTPRRLSELTDAAAEARDYWFPITVDVGPLLGVFYLGLLLSLIVLVSVAGYAVAGEFPQARK
jgi:hypothetical protein